MSDNEPKPHSAVEFYNKFSECILDVEHDANKEMVTNFLSRLEQEYTVLGMCVSLTFIPFLAQGSWKEQRSGLAKNRT